jgi:hypothetical protein
MHMNTSFYLAQLLAPILIFGGVSLLVNRKELKKSAEDFFSSSIASMYVGLFALFIGLFIAVSHNVWDGTWRSVITLLGWIIIVKSVFLLISPHEVIEEIVRRCNKLEVYMMQGIVWIVFGLYLALVGFGTA